MTRITRVEIIDGEGRSYVNWEDDNDIVTSIQDDGKTLKVFVGKTPPEQPITEEENERYFEEAKQIVEKHFAKKKMTEKERIEGEIKLLQKKLDLLEEIEKQPKTLFDVIQNLGYSVDCSWEIVDAIEEFEKSKEFQPTPQTPEQVEEGLRDAMRTAKEEGVFDEPEYYDELVENGVSENKQKPKTLYDILYRWWMDIFCNPIYRDWDMETSIQDLVDRIEFWNMRIKNDDDEVELDEQENDKNFKNSLDLIKEWGEKNKPPSFYEILWEWYRLLW
jgi:hypothetical protein